MNDLDFEARLTELRDGFDAAFARPATLTSSTASIGLLAIRVGGEAYAIRIDELADVQKRCPVAKLPGAHPGQLGIAGVRGRLVPVYSLAALLGRGDSGAWSWLAICGTERPLGLAFDELEGYVQSAPTDLVAASDAQRARGYVREVHRADTARMVVCTSSIVGMLSAGAGKGR
jgi:purine-binding chemotaxis protein CheW